MIRIACFAVGLLLATLALAVALLVWSTGVRFDTTQEYTRDN